MNYNSGIDEWVKSNSLGSPDSPSQQWVSEHAVDEECWQIPQPRQLDVDCWKGLLHKLPIISFNFIVWASKVFVLLTEVKSWNQENENGRYERY